MRVADRYSRVSHHPLDDHLRLLADHNRRAIISELRRSSDEMRTFEELINRLHEDAANTEQAQLAIKLRHTHLPKLADHGLLEYDRRSGAVRYDADERVETLLDALPDQIPRPQDSAVDNQFRQSRD